jgi:hypothetical protein
MKMLFSRLAANKINEERFFLLVHCVILLITRLFSQLALYKFNKVSSFSKCMVNKLLQDSVFPQLAVYEIQEGIFSQSAPHTIFKERG